MSGDAKLDFHSIRWEADAQHIKVLESNLTREYLPEEAAGTETKVPNLLLMSQI